MYALFILLLASLLPYLIQFLYYITIYAAITGDLTYYLLIFTIYLGLFVILKLSKFKFDKFSNKLSKVIFYIGFIHLYGCMLASSFIVYYPLIPLDFLLPIIVWKYKFFLNNLILLKFSSKFFNPLCKIFYEYRAECLVVPSKNKFTFIKIIELEPFKDIFPFIVALSKLENVQRFTFEVEKQTHDYSIYFFFFMDSKKYNTGISQFIDTFTRIIYILERLGYYYNIINDEISAENIFFSFLNSNPLLFDNSGLVKNFPKIKLNKMSIEINSPTLTSTQRIYQIPYNKSFHLSNILNNSPYPFYWICQFSPLDYNTKIKEIKTSLQKIYQEMQDKILDKEKQIQFLLMMGGIEKDTNAFSSYIFGDQLWLKKTELESEFKKFETGNIIGIFNLNCYIIIDENLSDNIEDILGTQLQPLPPINYFKLLTRKINTPYTLTSRNVLNLLPFARRKERPPS
ncbi:MAG: hypothetical protein ACTSWR_06285 [Candidatus Helarchaeota archaeon]